jgi:3-oxocholest-4-en-26-oyl-CoA dehydrogenase beta subunit
MIDLALTETEEMLKTMARDFLTTECPNSFVRKMEKDEKGFTPELWKKIADVGWLGLPFPEQYGGSGASFTELCVLIEEMGRACLPGPFFSTVILGGLTILDAGTDEQKKSFLSQIGQGKTLVTFAYTEANASYKPAAIQTKATKQGNNYVINGTKMFVPDANSADYIICIARTSENANAEQGLTAFIVPTNAKGIKVEVLETIAGDKLCRVIFKDVQAESGNILGKADQGWSVVNKTLQRAAAAKCCEMVGGVQKVLDMTVEYVKTRIQFNRPIGSFQVIHHYCAHMLTDVDTSRFVAYQAAWKFGTGSPCTKEISIAKAWVSEAYRRTTALALQTHGAIGFTMDHDMQFYYRRAKASELTYGDPRYHKELIAQETIDKN